jgi:tRNASer (uridine44-2'-O)-methyltransferase
MPGRRKGLDKPLLPLTHSSLRATGTTWLSSPSYQQSSLPFSSTAFHSVTDALLENPNLNSTHLFRADIIFDSTGILKTNKEKEDFCCVLPPDEGSCTNSESEALPVLQFAGFELKRTVLRRLIPRKPQLDRSLLQTCHIYSAEDAELIEPDAVLSSEAGGGCNFAHLSLDEKLNNKSLYKQSIACHSQHLVVYQPHADPSTGIDMPWYHPPLKSLAFLYSRDAPPNSQEKKLSWSTLSVHFQLYSESCPVEGPISLSITDRVHRTVLSLLSTFTRMVRNTPVCPAVDNGEDKAMPISATQHIKDNIVPEHLIQNTYSRLKTQYASDLIKGWVEKTDPSKHVFEDLSIAAFLLELWRKMYGNDRSNFPGFVDIACGNGVLTYVLIMEGFRGWGFDARVRRTWSIFPAAVTEHLREAVCIPRPFLRALKSHEYPLQGDLQIHDGIFEKGTFIISNHADELTTWTPLLAALSCPESPLPWLAIPCCSHALSGAAYRYSPFPPQSRHARVPGGIEKPHHDNNEVLHLDEQPRVGDLSALRAFKDQTLEYSEQKPLNRMLSTYASLVNQVTYLAKKADSTEDVQQTLMRIPSTRNIGIVGGQLRGKPIQTDSEGELIKNPSSSEQLERVKRADLTRQTIYNLVDQECIKSGGVGEAAKIWMESVRKAIGTTRHTFSPG